MVKAFFVHFGGSKTGSSAVQNFFELHAEEVTRLGVNVGYITGHRHYYQMGPGNGWSLFYALTVDGVSDDVLDSIITRYFGDYDKAWCSSEFFHALECNHIERLLAAARRLNIVVHVFFYIRDVVPFIVSNYDQSIKRNGEARRLEDALEGLSWSHGAFLRRVEPYRGELNLLLESYEQNIDDIFSPILKWVGLNEIAAGEEIRETRVNRSLYHDERALLVKINREFGDLYSGEISDYFFARRREPPAADRPSAAVKAKLEKAYAGEVAWVNETYFSGAEVVRVAAAAPKSAPGFKSPAPQEMADQSTAEGLFVDWCVEKMKTFRHSLFHEMAGIIMKFDREDEDDVNSFALPYDFNPIAYLVLNPDLIVAGVDPRQHFAAFGASEGRQYKFKSHAYPLAKRAIGQLENAINEQKAVISAMQTQSKAMCELVSQLQDMMEFQHRVHGDFSARADHVQAERDRLAAEAERLSVECRRLSAEAEQLRRSHGESGARADRL